ncbi:EF Tu GTP binding domain-containing protein [Dichomitus squalens]|uniref:Elongation factor 1 alpha-like protein n=1 Tax=Dichomitus squalens TaxID=114155 RepID=A0A4Q9MVP1_9APHY|nr:EF Tu GTP binding domain-containing protein [Dichomitus squalens]
MTVDQRQLDIAGLNLDDDDPLEVIPDEPAKPPAAVEKLIEEAKAALTAQEKSEKRSLSLVVVGHVDAGKSTMMGRLLYELGRIDEKKRVANERGSAKIGKSSFSWAWELDGTQEERERGITMDIALQTLNTPHRIITILDAPGHRDFIPNMISGASQADSALLVVDAAVGEFEAGFDRGGQTREHLLLVRSLGVSQVIVAVNKLDQVEWAKSRYNEIVQLLKPFLVQSGFHPSKTKFVPVVAMEGVNLTRREPADCPLFKWYDGPTLVDLLDALDPPTRDINAPLRFPISNIFKGTTSGITVSGRVCGGIVVAGERLRIVPGDESATVKLIDNDGESLPWAGAGSNVNLILTSVDPVSLNIGSVLCRPGSIIPLTFSFIARIIVFDIQIPITAGTSIELFHHSLDVPASISRLISVLDRSNGNVIKSKPRVLTKNMSAEVEISLRGSVYSGPASRALPIPIEPFSVNKEMGRILVRRGGETIGAGVVTELLT